MAPVASPRAPTPLLACQAVFPERRTLVDDSLLQSFPNCDESHAGLQQDDKRRQPCPDKLMSKLKTRRDSPVKLLTATDFREHMPF